MDVGLVGLGRMGMGMARRWHAAGHNVIVYNRSHKKVDALVAEGLKGAYALEELVQKLSLPRVVYVMLPAGKVTEEMVLGEGGLAQFLVAGDCVIDGGNSHFRDSVRRASILQDKGIGYVDQGTSGGLAGATRGYCLMVGGERADVERIEPLLRDLAMPEGYAHVGRVGAGHFSKMVHNAIEYGMMQSLAEGLELLDKGPYPEYDYAALLDLWQHGSIVSSYLVEVLQQQFQADPRLASIDGKVGDNGEGRWAVEEALKAGIPFQVITASVFARYSTRQIEPFYGRVLSAMRLGFGGHKPGVSVKE